jgi:hypothetical protein
MKLSSYEYLAVGLAIFYIAFFTHPPPSAVSQVFSNPLGHVGALALVLFATSKSYIVGLFVAIAYLLSTNSTLEYFETPSKSKKEEKNQPSSSMVSPALAKSVLGELLGKSGKLSSVAGKSVTEPPKPTQIAVAAPPSKEYTPVK